MDGPAPADGAGPAMPISQAAPPFLHPTIHRTPRAPLRPRIRRTPATLLRDTLYALRGGFLVRPMVIALTLGLTGAALSSLEAGYPILAAWVPRALFPSRTDPQVAQVILAGIAASIMTVVSIVFAILLMTLTLASMQFSPRILVSFVRDRTTQWTLGLFLGTFAYCLGALPAARTVPAASAPVAATVGAMALALLCVGWLIFFIQHISQAISVNHIVDRIARETEDIIDGLMPHDRAGDQRRALPAFELHGTGVPVPCVVSGYIRFVDIAALVSAAKAAGVQLRVLRRVGHFVPAGIPLLVIHGRRRLRPEVMAVLLGAFDIGPIRTLQQDVEFGVIQIVDIALRAISPAVNDPSTAITCLDQLGRILIRWISRYGPEVVLCDPPHVVRVVLPAIELDGLLNTAFEQIRHYAVTDAVVSARLLRVLDDIASTTDDPGLHRHLVARGRRVLAGCRDRLAEDDLGLLRHRLDRLEARLAPDPASHAPRMGLLGRLPEP